MNLYFVANTIPISMIHIYNHDKQQPLIRFGA